MALQAMQLHIETEQIWNRASPPLKTAFIAGMLVLEGAVNNDFQMLQKFGGLLFAHCSTTRPARIQIGGAA